jgi:hypothetical protein
VVSLKLYEVLFKCDWGNTAGTSVLTDEEERGLNGLPDFVCGR